MQLCLEFSRINSITITETYSLPLMEDYIDSRGDAKIFSVLDALWGYWHVQNAEGDPDEAKFTSHIATFRYSSMPFGLRNAPTTFQRALEVM